MTMLANDNSTLSDKEKLLALLLEESQTDTNKSILKADRTQPLPLSFTQERLWFLEQLQPGSSLYNLGGSFTLTGSLDIDSLQKSFQDVVDRHEVLRTTFPTRDGEPAQIIKEALDIDFPIIDLTGKTAAEQDSEIRRLHEKEGSTPFDFEAGPLLRLTLVKISPTEHQLLMSIHHIISDDWGMSVFSRDLCEFYRARVTQTAPCLEPLEYQYADLAYTQRQDMQGPNQKRLLDYWKNRLAGMGESMDLPSDRPRPAVQSFTGDQVCFSIPAEQVETLRKLSRDNNSTLFMTMLAALKIFLYRYTQHTDIVVGTTIAQRNCIEMENLVGVFINNLVLRTDLSGNPDFKTLIGRIRETCLGAFEHEALPFERLVEELNPKRDRSRNPLFQVMFVYLSSSDEQQYEGGVNITRAEKQSGASEYDLTLYIRDEGDQQEMECWFEFSTALFDKATILRMQTHFSNLLNSLIEHPATDINQAAMLSDTERDWLINRMNNSAASTPDDHSLHELIAAQAQSSRDKIAVVSDNDTLTYGELNSRANQLAHFLIDQGVQPGVKVGVLLDRDANMMVGLLGVLKAGGAYVPIDPSYPAARIEYMIHNSGAPVILTTHHLLANLPQSDARVICLDLDWQEMELMPESDPEQPVSTDQLAYVIYTSGSTGHPKGVQVTHANVVNFVHSISKRPGFSADDTLLAITTISFDIHVLELFVPLYTGGKVVVASQHTTQDGSLLLERIRQCDITFMQATPATWRMMIQAGWEEALPLKVVSGGEKLTEELASDLFPRVQNLWNLYGPTETTVWSAGAEITDTNEPITIHQYVDNTELYIMDSSLELVPVGVPGELLIGGKGVTQGYLNRPELTQENFVENPLEGFQGKCIYHTGDLARYLPDGRIQLLGRKDHQIKLRGFRIEVGEIEKVLENHDAIRQAVVILREDQPGDQRLVAYLLGTEADADNMILREWLKNSLPDYMVPNTFVWLAEYPKTPNNKIDRKAMPSPSSNGTGKAQENYVAPQSPLESILVSLFQEVLQSEGIGCYDNFFDLGGHSLLSMKVVSRFEKATGIHMHPAELFQQTIGQIAAFHEQAYSQSQ
jgi:amino acid adenylation domain-containing protein